MVSTTGVQEDQAKGGASLLPQLAKDKLGDGAFSQLSSSLPRMDELLQAAPPLAAGGGRDGLLSKMLSMFGGQAGSLGSLTNLSRGFSHLGLDGGMVAPFIPIVLSFVQEQGGESAKNLLERVLR